MSDITTVTLDGGELKVEGLNGQNTEIINKSDGAVYASKSPGVVPEADGVIEIAANTRDGLHGTNGTLYLLGAGKVELRGTDYSVNFRQPSSSAGGGGGTSRGNGGVISEPLALAGELSETFSELVEYQEG